VFRARCGSPTLEYFLPAQMCHMKVMEKYRLWHGACPSRLTRAWRRSNPIHFDGYSQGPRRSQLPACEPVPDSTAAAGTTPATGTCAWNRRPTPSTAWRWRWELFHSRLRQHHHRPEDLITEIHQPDGKPDVLQQLEHGRAPCRRLRILGRLYRGIIEPTLRQYVFLGDGALMTDNVVSPIREDTHAAPPWDCRSPDDRWVFTENNARRELHDGGALAAASRALKGYNDDLAARSLKAAIAIYDRGQAAGRMARVGAATSC
jgi:hypothetical protein